MKTLRYLLLAAVLVFAYTVSATAAPLDCSKKIESFDFVVDYSGSMAMTDKKAKMTKLAVVKELMHRINGLAPAQAFNAGLHTISPNGTLLAEGPWDRGAMDQAIDKMKTDLPIFGRMTYMGDSLTSYESFLSSMPRNAAIILFTDADNNKGSDFVEVVRQIYANQRGMTVHMVYFDDTKNGAANIKAIAEMNPEAQVVSADELFESDAALEAFCLAVFCGQGEVLTLRGVNFAFDSYKLDGKAQAILNEAAEVIKQHEGQNVLLTGWTDSRGSDAYNARLSQNRANAVKAYLSEQGVPASRIQAVGKGKSFKYDNSTEEGRYENRRTEITFD